MDTAVPGALEVATRRMLAAQFVVIIGPAELRNRARAFTEGKLGEAEVATMVADLDRIARMLIPGCPPQSF